MNSIHKINSINEKELALGVSDEASWHADYKDTAYIYIGNLHTELKEEDIIKIFSQYGNPSHINLVKDKETGKPRGFCYLKYEDHRSCVLAVDNFNGTKIYERPLKVDHTYFRLMEGQNEDDFKIEYPEVKPEKPQKRKVQLLDYKPETIAVRSDESAQLQLEHEQKEAPIKLDDDDFDDPMASILKLHESDRKRRKTRDKDGHNDRHRHKDIHKDRNKDGHKSRHKDGHKYGHRDGHKERHQAHHSSSLEKERKQLEN